MKIQIKSRYTNVIMHEYEEESLKIAVVKSVKSGADLRGADLRGADLRRADLGGADLGGADLRGADLRGADLRRAEQYSESHDVFCELVRIQKSSAFTAKEWEFIAHISIHRICWDTITGKFRNAAMRVFKKLAKAGHNEYLKKFQKVTK